MTDLPTREHVVAILNKSFLNKRNPSVHTLSGGKGGNIVSLDVPQKEMTMYFRGTESMCNGKPGKNAQVQGGFASAMLDAVTSNMVVVWSRMEKTVTSLEQKTVFISPVPPNTDLFGIAKVIKTGRSVAFLEAQLREGTPNGKLLCTSTTTVLLIALPSRVEKMASKL